MSGTIWMYSQYIDDEDLEFAKKEFITYKMGREYYGLGEKPMIRLAWESGAVYKVGKRVLIKRDMAYAKKLPESIEGLKIPNKKF